MDCVVVVTTVGTVDEARLIARSAVERRLAACAQIEPIESFYRWEGAVQHDQEYRVLLKSVAARYGDLEAMIQELHSYELPAIYAYPLQSVLGRYAQWVQDNSNPG
jgi:periplasmic divalent cation tolerance protein